MYYNRQKEKLYIIYKWYYVNQTNNRNILNPYNFKLILLNEITCSKFNIQITYI